MTNRPGRTSQRPDIVRQYLWQHISRRVPRNTRLTALTIRNTGSFRFKRALLIQVSTRNGSGQTSSLLLHANIPSQDTRHETVVADTLERVLARSRRFSGPFNTPISFGIVKPLRANLYEHVPGAPLTGLWPHNPRRAVAVSARAAHWLSQLASLRLSVGARRKIENSQRDARYFLENITKTSPRDYEPVSILLATTVQALAAVVHQNERRVFRTIHGDLNLGNIIDGGKKTALIDYGNSCIFDPMSDVGNFLAQVDALVWEGQLTPSLGHKLQRSFLAMPDWKTPDNRRRIAVHRAWWTLQVCAYTCATRPAVGRKTLPRALHAAKNLLTSVQFAPRQAFEDTPKSRLTGILQNEIVMTAYFGAHIEQFFPGRLALVSVSLYHQSALSTTSFLMRYKLTVQLRSGQRVERIIRGNRISPKTYALQQHVYRHAKHFSTLRPLAYHRVNQYLFYEELPGTPLRKISPAAREYPDLLRKIGRALAALHSIPVGTNPRISLADENLLLRRAVQKINQHGQNTDPWLIDTVKRLVTAEQRVWNNHQSIVHNDFQASNILRCGPGIGLIDFTMGGVAHPAIDVGNFLAHLQVMLLGQVAAEKARRYARSFLDGYRSSGQKKWPAIASVLPVFEARSCVDILAITAINLGPNDPHRRQYVALLLNRLLSLRKDLP